MGQISRFLPFILGFLALDALGEYVCRFLGLFCCHCMLWETALCWGGLGKEELKPLVFLIDIFCIFIFFVFRICRTVRDWGTAVCWGGLGEVELKPVGRKEEEGQWLGK